jgi:lysophospholipase L1-like esterase
VQRFSRFAVLAGAVAVVAAPALTAPAPVSAAAIPVSAAPMPARAATGWTTAWATAQAAAVRGAEQGYAGYTIRNVVHTTAGGDTVRVHLSNRFGNAPVLMGHVTVGLSAHKGGADDPSDGSAGVLKDVHFGGAASVTVPARAEIVSDPVRLRVPADRDLLVSTWTPQPSGLVTYHPAAMQTSFFTRGPEDRAGARDATAFGETTGVWHYVSAVDVSGGPGTVVALGDSITDGVTSTPGANRRWTDYLAGRLRRDPAPDYGVANSGISGNRILLDANYPNYSVYEGFGVSALARLDRDVLERAGARTVIVFEGVNDIQQTPHQTDPTQIIAGLAQITTQARARGLRVVGATIMPFEGWNSWTPELEATRGAVNAWIRSRGRGTLDGVADFDAATRDPAAPTRIRPDLDSGDHLHPNDRGDEAMAAVIPLSRL